MITWKMIKELTENPEKEFVSYELQGSGDVLKAKSINGAIRFSNEENRWHEVLLGIDLEREWEEIKKPVDFMTAIASGKRIKVEHDILPKGSWVTKLSELDGFIDDLGAYCSSDIREILLRGKWYIED